MFLIRVIVLLHFFFEVTISTCSYGQFTLNSIKCRPWLSCIEIQDLTLGDLIGYGAVKQVYKSSWNNFSVAVAIINNSEFAADFHHALDLLIRFQPSKYFPVLIGYCRNSNVYVTKFYSFGSLLNFDSYLPSETKQNFKRRFGLCLNYIEIINYLHTVSETPFVMCDTNSLNKTLGQYLLAGNDEITKVIVNDIDALAQVKEEGVICGNKEITGNFIAPEQRWPYKGKPYDHNVMVKYDEKTDVWKIPSVCNHLLGDSKDAVSAKYHLFKINKKCLTIDPIMRPSASEVLIYYKSVYSQFFIQKEEL